MFDPFAWAWPQWTLFVLMVVAFAASAVQHDKPKPEGEKYNGFVGAFRFLLWMFLLVFGGFFAG